LSTRQSIIINQTLNNAGARAETQYFPSRLTSTWLFLPLLHALSPMMRTVAGISAVFGLQFRSSSTTLTSAINVISARDIKQSSGVFTSFRSAKREESKGANISMKNLRFSP
jgi:hypothetical protein